MIRLREIDWRIRLGLALIVLIKLLLHIVPLDPLVATSLLLVECLLLTNIHLRLNILI